MQAAHAAGNLSLSRPAAGEAGLVFRNYAQPGDSMTLEFAMATHKLRPCRSTPTSARRRAR